jgi:formamidopyrimidine-DNA glycosylase
MPELPEVEAVRRRLNPVMRDARFDQVILRREGLRRPFPHDFARRLRGRTVRSVNRRGKYLLADLSSGETLLMHLGMSGSFRISQRRNGGAARRRTADVVRPHDHVTFEMSSGASVTFNDPRRFGVMDLAPSSDLGKHPALGAIGPEPLSPAFSGAALARAVAGKRTSLKAALLDQRVVAGVGNIYASEALHLAGLSPRQQARSIATPSGEPRPSANRLAAAIKTVLREAIDRRSAGPYRESRFRVYDREGQLCARTGCRGTIRRITQTGRSTFYCGACQKR